MKTEKPKLYSASQVDRMVKRGCMSVRTQPGMKVVFAAPNNGYDIEVKQSAAAGLKLGAVYTVKDISVGRSSTSIKLDEFPGSFNSVQFCNLPKQELPDTIHNWGYAPIHRRKP